MERNEIARQIFQRSHLTGTFRLRSGKTSNEYFDKYQFESDPHLLRAIGKAMLPLVPQETEALAALEMGGIPIAVALAFETELPLVFVRKQAKDYGTCRFAEGASVVGKKLTIIEDVITTGGQVLKSCDDLRTDGALITDVLCVINRSEGPLAKFSEAGLQLHALFKSAELKSSLAGND